MAMDVNKTIARRFVDEVFGGRHESVAELVAPDFVGHSWGPQPVDRAGLDAAIDRVGAGLSDHSMQIDDLIAEGDRVAVRLRSHARHTGPFMGMPATGREYTITETHVLRIRDGQVVEHWRDADMLGLMQQLGMLPTPGAGGAQDAAKPATGSTQAPADPA
jgi:predicted ester cyclase